MQIAIDCEDFIKSKTFIVTGSNTGIGLETVKVLLLNGGKVIMACRDTNKAKIALEEIKLINPNINGIVMKLDLTSFKQIREFAQEFIDQHESLDVLINNAGVMACPLD